MYRKKLSLKGLLTGCTLLLTTCTFHVLANQAPNNDEHCVKRTMPGKKNNVDSFEENNLSRKGLPSDAEDKTKVNVLPDNVINKFVINAGFGWGIFNGSIYNGNSNYTITQLIVRMTPIHDHHMEMTEKHSTAIKEYTIDLNLLPLSKTALSLAIDTDSTHIHDFEWQIIQALGHESNALSDSKRCDTP